MIILLLVLSLFFVCNSQPDRFSSLESESCGLLTRTEAEIQGDEPLFPPTNNERIAGGRESTSDGEWYPWAVELRISFSISVVRGGVRGILHQLKGCSGVIINRWWIVSAAHCFITTQTNPDGSRQFVHAESRNVEINVGMFGRPRREVNEPMIQTKAARIVQHERYLRQGEKNQQYDIALLRLMDRLEFIVIGTGVRGNRYQINSICLPRRVPDVTGRTVHASAGFGLIGTAQNVNRSLMVMSLVYPVHYDRCLDNINRFRPAFIFNYTRDPSWAHYQVKDPYTLDPEFINRTLCTSILLDNQSICHGDSGGPLMVRRPDGERFELTGVNIGHYFETNETFDEIITEKEGQENIQFLEIIFDAYSKAYPCGFQSQFINTHQFLEWIRTTINNDERTRAGEDYIRYVVYTIAFAAFAGAGGAQIQQQIKNRRTERLAREEAERPRQPPLTPRGVARSFNTWIRGQLDKLSK